METTDPLTRLAHIMVGLQSRTYSSAPTVPLAGNGSIELGAALSYITGRTPEGEKFTKFEGLQDFANVLQLSLEAQKYVEEKSPARAKERNLGYLRTILDRLNESAPTTNAGYFDSANFPPENVHRLQAMAENLSDSGEERVVPMDDIKEIVRQIDALTEYIVASGIDDRLRDALVRTLGTLRMELQRVNILGATQVVDNLDRLLGQAVRAAITPGTQEQHQQGVEVFRKSVEVAEGIGKVVDVVQKVYPVLEAGARALGILP